MSAGTPEQEPSIEEILASIRQIISDDDEGAPASSAEPEPVAKPQPAPPPPPPPPPPPKEDILELKDPLPEPARPVIDMEDAFEEDKVDDDRAPSMAVHDDEDSILSDTAKSAALTGFSKLASNIPLERGTTPHRSSDGSTLEDIVRDMLNPMLRVWLDENLPKIIEKLVQKELEKLARRASDD